MNRLLSIFFLIGLGLHAQVKTDYPITVFSVNDGLAQSVVYTLFQESEGSLWLGTQAGVSIFDGRSFQNFNSSHGLPHNTVRFITQKESGEVVLATDRGLAIYNGMHFEPLPSDQEEIPSEVRKVIQVEDGSLWGTSFSHGVFRYHQGVYTYFDQIDGIPNKQARAIIEDSRGRIWVGFYGNGLAYYENNQWHKIPSEPHHNSVRVIYEMGPDHFLVGTNTGVYILWDDLRLEKFSEDPRLQASITAIEKDPSGKIWIATNQSGVICISGEEFIHFQMKNGLSNNGVQSILVDNEEKLWFGTYGGGVCRLGRNQFLNISSQKGFEYDNVYALFQDTDDSIWIGTNGGGLSIIRDGKMVSYLQGNGLRDNKIFTIAKDARDRIWIGTINGANYFENGEFQSFTAAQGLPHNLIFHICPTKDGRILFGTLRGLGILDNGKTTTLLQEDGLTHNRIHHVLELRNGDIWLGTTHGISVMRGQAIIRTITKQDGLVGDEINHLYQASDDSVWIATTEGLVHYRDNEFVSYSTRQGLSSPLCNVVIEDQEGFVWVGTSNGLNRFDGKHFATYSHRDGLPSNEINRNAGIRDKNGRLWFGTTNGVTQFETVDPSGELPPPYINLTGIRVMGNPRPLKLDEPLEHWERFVEVYFNGISFSDAENIHYRYRLVGLDNKWIDTKAAHAAFVNLPAGDFRFEVEAINSEGTRSVKPAILSFRIKPPFWRKGWFYAVAGVTFLSLIWFQIWNLRRQNQKLEEVVSTRTQALKQLALWDQLTGARNRHYLDLIMPSEMAKLKRDFYAANRGYENTPQYSLGIAMLDIDHFKTINDTFGHEVGDMALAELSKRMKSLIRESDSLIRWGGEEFLLILPRIDFEQLKKLCGRLRQNISTQNLVLSSGKNIPLSISIGFTIFPVDHDPMDYDWRKLVNLADMALYKAKKSGRDLAIGFNPQGYVLVDLFRMIEAKPGGIPDYMAQGFTVLNPQDSLAAS